MLIRAFIPVLFLFLSFQLFSQGPGSLFVDAGPDVIIDCSSGGCTDITATYQQTFETISEVYTVSSIPFAPPFAFNGLANQLNPNIDDAWSVVENLPFDFCFFGGLERQFQVGSNGVLRFDVNAGDTSNAWSFSANIPNNTQAALAEANVFTPVHDIDPSASGSEEIGYEVLGTAPNRVLVVSYYEVPMYDCTGLLATHMAVFYEFSNIIEFYILNKPTCTSWNGGNAALGIQNDAGTVGYAAPGRNTSDSPWTTANEAWRFAPNGVETSVFEWLDSTGAVIGTTPTINVCPTGTETYTARVTYTNTCNGDVVVLTDEVDVTSNTPFTLDLGPDVNRCNTDPVLLDAETGNPAVTYQWFINGNPLPGETNPTYTVNSPDSGTYGCEATDTICTLFDEVEVQYLEQPVIANPPNDLYKCDDGVQAGEFELRLNRPVVLGGQDPAVFQVSFHNSQDDADTGNMPILNEITYPITGTQETIYVRIQELTRTCFTTDSFMLFFEPPVFSIDLGPDIDSCDDDPVVLDAETGDPQVTYQWYLDGNPIAGATNPTYTVNRPDSGSYSCEGTDGVCLVSDSVEVRYFDQPVANEPIDLYQCDDGNNTGEFDLTVNRPIVIGGQDSALFEVSFHQSQDDANTGNAPITNEILYGITGNVEDIYVRIQDLTGICYDTEVFEIRFEPASIGTLTNVEVCDQAIDGFVELNLSELKDEEALDGQDPATFLVTYHDNPIDANTGDNPLGNPYPVNSPGATVYVRVERFDNSDCYAVSSFDVIIYNPPIANPPSDLEECDDDNDGFTDFTLSDRDQEIIGLAMDVFVLYYLTEALAEVGDPSTALPDSYINEEPNNQVVWARLTDDVPSGDTRPTCYDVVPLRLVVNPVPEPEIEDTYRLCVDENGNPLPAEEGQPSPPVIYTGLSEMDYSFSWMLDGNPLPDDEDPSQPEEDGYTVATSAGIYSIIVSDLLTGCQVEVTTEVTVSSPPILESVEVTGELFSGDYNIIVTVSGSGDYVYKLDNGPFQESNVFENVSRGLRVIIVKDTLGCGSFTEEVMVIDYPKFFTPNQDGYNDTWNIEGFEEVDPNAQVLIFDRFGKFLKQVRIQGEGWDGTYEGRPLPSSDYWFLIEYETAGVKRQFRNHFTLKR